MSQFFSWQTAHLNATLLHDMCEDVQLNTRLTTVAVSNNIALFISYRQTTSISGINQIYVHMLSLKSMNSSGLGFP